MFKNFKFYSKNKLKHFIKICIKSIEIFMKIRQKLLLLL